MVHLQTGSEAHKGMLAVPPFEVYKKEKYSASLSFTEDCGELQVPSTKYAIPIVGKKSSH